ncbi:MAG: glutamine--fructose-6-phosphate transaminase (isomerizing) [Granulosicoccaceae bacterium]|jgi:glucosamine--fructose-6-phosphate aminotransferase (isomerizing)
MCGIVGAIAQRDVLPILIEGLRRLEYRGYDSAGVALVDEHGCLSRVRTQGKVQQLADTISAAPVSGRIGIAHTRWATHGKPSEENAHPHVCNKAVAIVHNGIIENHELLRSKQVASGYAFTSETDTEVIVHEIYSYLDQGMALREAVQATTEHLHGAYALGVVANDNPDLIVAARRGSPLVIGLGIGENFIASDVAALLPVTQRFIFLEEGDIAEIRRERVSIFNAEGEPVERNVHESELGADAVERGEYRHYMQKEIFEQSRAIAETLEGRISTEGLLEESFGPQAKAVFDKVEAIQIVACGTSYHAGLIAKYGFEGLSGVPCHVEVASEFRYRKHVVAGNTLFVTISQSGETADTLAALRVAKQRGYEHTLAICNVPESSIVRESDLVLMTRAGPEIGVASTKAFTTQLVALLLLIVAIGRHRDMHRDTERKIMAQLFELPQAIEEALKLNNAIEILAKSFADKHHALFLGRGPHWPVAMEGALKLKEISYIHAEAYPAGELKHGPLALVDADMPVIAVAPNDELLEKLKANLQEVSARGGQLIVFTDPATGIKETEGIRVLHVAATEKAVSPIIYSIPLQLLAYHVAVIKGTDIDQPRNLAKSVTVE